MSEWWSVVAAFWAFYAFDGVGFSRDAAWNIVSWLGGGRARLRFHRVQLASPWPGSWRATTHDLPFALSPDGICNVPAGSAARPASLPAVVHVAAWSQIQTVSAKKGWLLINGARFCADTGHLTADRLQTLARRCGELDPAARASVLQAVLAGWIRPAHLRRRASVLRRRTRTVAALNGSLALLLAAWSVYLLGNVADLLTPRRAETVAAALPLFAVYGAALHLAGVVLFARAHRRLHPQAGERRVSLVASALLLPPQAMRLRALAGTAWFPAQHPVAWALAFGSAAQKSELVFNALADLRWPLTPSPSPAPRPAAADAILGWFRTHLAGQLERRARAAGVAVETLFAPPAPDGAASCRYCPRCRDQFVGTAGECPHGVPLKPLRG